MLVVTDLRCWFHKLLNLLFPNAVRDTGAKTRAWFEIRPLGCRERAGSNLARSDEPLLSLPTQGRSASRHVDQIHLSLFTAVCVPVQRSGTVPVISPCRSRRNDYEYFMTPCLTFPDESSCLYYETLSPSRTRDRGFVGDTVREM